MELILHNRGAYREIKSMPSSVKQQLPAKTTIPQYSRGSTEGRFAEKKANSLLGNQGLKIGGFSNAFEISVVF